MTITETTVAHIPTAYDWSTHLDQWIPVLGGWREESAKAVVAKLRGVERTAEQWSAIFGMVAGGERHISAAAESVEEWFSECVHRDIGDISRELVRALQELRYSEGESEEAQAKVDAAELLIKEPRRRAIHELMERVNVALDSEARLLG